MQKKLVLCPWNSEEGVAQKQFGVPPESQKVPHWTPSSVAEAKCENVWMEVCTKVAAAALVSVPWRVSVRVGLK